MADAAQPLQAHIDIPVNINEMKICLNRILDELRSNYNLNQIRRYKELFLIYQNRWFGNQELTRLFREIWDIFEDRHPNDDILKIYGDI